MNSSRAKVSSAFRDTFHGLNAYDRHCLLINNYVKYYSHSDKREPIAAPPKNAGRHEIDIIQDHFKFVWDIEDPDEREIETESQDSLNAWEKRVAKKYYDSLYKEYCLADLTHYREGKIALRWRIENEVLLGKGHLYCGNLKCDRNKKLTHWEVNFGYIEEGHKKNALVKLCLCRKCSHKLNYHHKIGMKVISENSGKQREPKKRKSHHRSKDKNKKERKRSK